jgi:hypothetical protein
MSIADKNQSYITWHGVNPEPAVGEENQGL